MKLGNKLTKFASAMIVWCMLSTSLMGLLLIAAPSDVEGASATSNDVIIDSSNPYLNRTGGIYVLGANLIIRDGGHVTFKDCQIHVTQNEGSSGDLMYYITVEDGGELNIINSTIINQADTQNEAAPGLGILVRNDATMYIEDSTLAFPGHFVVDNAKLTMVNSVVKGNDIANCNTTVFPISFFNDAPVMMFISADIQLYNSKLLDTFNFDKTGWDTSVDLFNFNYPFASDDAQRNVVTYTLERNVEGIAAIAKNDSQYYIVNSNKNITTSGVDIAGLSFSADEVASITLCVEYKTASPFTATSPDSVQYILPNGTVVTTGITITKTWSTPGTSVEVVKSDPLDLAVYPMSSQDLANTQVYYNNSQTQSVSVNRIWFEVALNYQAYRNITLAGNTTFLAVNSVIDINNWNYDDEYNETANKLQILDQAQAYLYGTNVTSDAMTPYAEGIDPIICESEAAQILVDADSVVSNPGESSKNLTAKDSLIYHLSNGEILAINQFDFVGLSADVLSATLYINYTTNFGYTGTNYLNWGVSPGVTYPAIQITNFQGAGGNTVSYALNITDIDDLNALFLTFENNDPVNVNINQIWIEITLDPRAYIYRYASFDVTDEQALPVSGAEIELVDHMGNPAVYISEDGTSAVPPQEVLDYLGRSASNFTETDTYGQVTIPVLTEIVNSWSLPRSMDLYGVRSSMMYDATITYTNVTAVVFDETVAVAFDQFPELSIVDLELDVTMTGLYLDKPDLVLTNPGHAPAIIYSGQSGATVYVTVTNEGITAAQNVVVRVLDIYQGRTTIIGSELIVGLDAGDSALVTVDWTGDLNGTHEIKFIVDPLDTIIEEDETNNMISHTVNVLYLLPDLSVSNDEIDFSMYPAMTDMPLIINATVNNTDGRVAAVNATVSFYLGEPSNGILIGTTKVTVSAGGQANATLTWTPNVVGKYTIYVVVSGVTEYSYDNNTAHRNLTIYVSDSGQLEVNDTVGTMYITQSRYEEQNVIIRENGTLMLNATLFFHQGAANQYWIVVQDNGTLVLNAKGLISSYYPLTVYLADNANLTIIGASAQSGSMITVIADDNSTVYIADSGVGYDFMAPSTSQASIVASDSTFSKAWSYFGGDAQADLTSVAIPKLDPSDNAVIMHYRWINVTTYDGTGTVLLSGVYVQLNSWNTAIPTYYASGISDSSSQIRFKALCDVITAGPSAVDYGNYKVNGTYWYDGNRADSTADVEVSLLFYTEPLTISNEVVSLTIPVTLTDVSVVTSDIKFSPTNPVTNQTATISVAVRNLGSQAADGTNVSFYLNTTGVGVLIATRTISNLPGGQAFTVSIPWTPNNPGTDVITIVLDEDRLLNETTRGNDQASISVQVLDVPHIYTTDISFYLGTGTVPITQAVVGSEVRIEAILTNNGESTATDFTVSFWMNAPYTGTLIDTVSIASILAGGNYTVYTMWEATSVSGNGAYQNRTVYITIDESEYTLATDEPQSQLIQIIDNRPDLIVENDVVVTKGGSAVTGASLGETITVWFNVSNVGLSAAENALVLVNLTNGTTNIRLKQFAVSLDPDETEQYNITYLVTEIALGAYDLNIWANPNQTFKEASAANNHYVAEFSVVVLHANILIELEESGNTEFAPGDKITVSGSIISTDGIPIVGQQVEISLRDSKGFQIGNAQTRTTGDGGQFITILNISPNYEQGDAYVTVTINDGEKAVSEQQKITITSEEGLPIPLWLVLLIVIVIVLVIVFFSWYLYRYSLGKMVECGECGSLIPEASKRCPKCGTIFETGTAKCSECGSWIPANAAECPECHAKFLTVPTGTEEGESYEKAMKKQYDEYVNDYRQQAMTSLGPKYSEDKFQEWLKTEPGFLAYDEWLKKAEEDKKMGAFPCPSCGTLNPRGSTICHKCGSVFTSEKSEKPAEEKPRTFRKIVKREDKKEGEEPKEPEKK